MKRALISVIAFAVCAITLLCFASCASTTILEGGQTVFKTQADISSLDFKTAQTTIHATGMIHSAPTFAGGNAAQSIINSISGSLATIGTSVVAYAAVAKNAIAAVIAPSAVGSVAHVSNAIANPPSKAEAVLQKHQ